MIEPKASSRSSDRSRVSRSNRVSREGLAMTSSPCASSTDFTHATRSAEFGADVLSRRSLDEVIVAHLAAR